MSKGVSKKVWQKLARTEWNEGIKYAIILRWDVPLFCGNSYFIANPNFGPAPLEGRKDPAAMYHLPSSARGLFVYGFSGLGRQVRCPREELILGTRLRRRR